MTRVVLVLVLVLAAALSAGCGSAGSRDGPPVPTSLDALRAELCRMAEEDQDARRRWAGVAEGGREAAWEEVAAIDARNTARLKAIVEAHGWPTKSLVGREGTIAAWLIVQHADRDRDFQERMLRLMAPLVAQGEARGADVALLTDRVLCARGDPQRYGSQYRIEERGGAKVLEPMTPIEDPRGLDARRAAMGLEPHAEYVEGLRRMYAEMLK